jgi:peroxidase
MELTRSAAYCSGTLPKRQQMNGITAFVDGSNVYGSDDDTATQLRTGANGLLLLADSALPKFDGEFTAGDVRALENPGLTSLHTLFVMEHNRIATGLKEMNRALDDEELYLRSRRLVGAQIQSIVYGQFLEEIMGTKKAEKSHYGLNLNVPSTYYDDMNPSIRNVFATAAYRFGHSMIQDHVKLMSTTGDDVGTYELKDNFFVSDVYTSSKEAILNGMTNQASQSSDCSVAASVANTLFTNTGFPGSDLLARNIQRGRDHGLPGYNEWRVKCFGESARLCDWNTCPNNIPQALWNKFSDLYYSPADIDLYSAGLAEENVEGGQVGKTFACIIGKQFEALKKGDRFFFTHGSGNPNTFTEAEAKMIRERTLGSIMCDNTNIVDMSPNVFVHGETAVSCSDKMVHPELDLGSFYQM